MTKAMNRRTFLRGALTGGALVALPLPRLSSMLNNNGTAMASGDPLPRRFGTWFFGNGIVPLKWNPLGQGTGSAWELSEQLAPLAPYKSHISVASGFRLQTISGNVHCEGPSGILTGALHNEHKSVQLPSIDQVVADVIAGDTAFRSIELGCSRAAPFDTGTCFFATSHRGPDAPNYPEFDPHRVFGRLFGVSSSDPALRIAKRSVLDAVREDLNGLHRKVGQADRHRLDQHAEAIRSIERRLTRVDACGEAIAPSVAYPGVTMDVSEEAPPNVHSAMTDMLVTALACDLTRVFSYMFTYPAAQIHFRHLGEQFDTAFHDNIVHEGDEEDSSGLITRGVVYATQSFAELIGKMDAIPEADGTLLDQSCIFATSCVGRGWDHDQFDYPLVVAGKAGGALKGNVHYRSQSEENTSKMLYTLANAMGANVHGIGLDSGFVESGIDAFLA